MVPLPTDRDGIVCMGIPAVSVPAASAAARIESAAGCSCAKSQAATGASASIGPHLNVVRVFLRDNTEAFPFSRFGLSRVQRHEFESARLKVGGDDGGGELHRVCGT